MAPDQDNEEIRMQYLAAGEEDEEGEEEEEDEDQEEDYEDEDDYGDSEEESSRYS